MVLENKNIATEIAFRPILGLGTTAITFLTKDKKVLKEKGYYYNLYRLQFENE